MSFRCVSLCYEKRMREYSQNTLKVAKSMLPRKGQVVIWVNALHSVDPSRTPNLTDTAKLLTTFDDDDFFFVPQLSVSENGHFNAFAIKQQLDPRESAVNHR